MLIAAWREYSIACSSHCPLCIANKRPGYYSDEGTQIFVVTLIPAAVFKLILLLMIVVKLKKGAVKLFKKLYKQVITAAANLPEK